MSLIRKPENSSVHPWLKPEVFGKSGKGTVILLGTMRASNSKFEEGIILDGPFGKKQRRKVCH